MSTTDRVVLSYGDTVIRESDLALLNPSQWLNDTLIHFYYDWLASQYRHVSTKLSLVCPSSMFLVRMAESSQMLQEVLAPLSLASRDYIFMPINNNQDWTQVGGTHWSLLVFDRPAGVFRYYDSYGRMNERFARETARRLLPVLYPSQKQQQPVFLVERTPQQQNSADCGVFVLAITEALIAPFAKAAGSEESGAARQVCLTSSEDLNRLVSQATVDALRIRMRRLVEQLATANSSSSSSSSSSS